MLRLLHWHMQLLNKDWMELKGLWNSDQGRWPSRKQNYTQIKREALALTWALVTAKKYLQYHPFTWTTDCKPLIGVLQNAADKPDLIWARSWDHIRSFPMEVSWMKGDLNPMDYPTRCFISRVYWNLYNQALKILDGDPSTNSIPKKRFRMIKKFVTRDENGLRWKKAKSQWWVEVEGCDIP